MRLSVGLGDRKKEKERQEGGDKEEMKYIVSMKERKKKNPKNRKKGCMR